MFYALDMYRGFFVNLLILFCLAGCGRIITPAPSGLVEVEPTPSATPVALTETPQPTSTPRLAVPQTPSIPTITPTPILYTVQSGDTLLKIATDFEITMEAIQAAARRIVSEADMDRRAAARTASIVGFSVTRGRTRL